MCMVAQIVIDDVLSAVSGVASLVIKDYVAIYYFVVEFKGASERSCHAYWRLLLYFCHRLLVISAMGHFIQEQIGLI